MTLAIDELPDDVALLKQLILSEREQRQAAIDAAVQAQIDEAVKTAVDEAVQAAVAAILRRYYGPRSESFDPRQLLLFGQVDRAIAARRGQHRRRSGRAAGHAAGQEPRPAWPAAVARAPGADRDRARPGRHEKACPACGSERCRIGAEVSEQLEYFPASFKVLKHIRHKYACAQCDARRLQPEHRHGGQAAAADRQGPARPEPVGLRRDQQAGRSPAAVPAGKHLRAAAGACGSQHDVRLDAGGGRTGRAAGRADEQRVLKQSRVIHTDDTPVPIQSPGAKQCRKGRIWCYLGDAANPYTVYDYTPSRWRDGPAEVAGGFSRLPASGRVRRLRRHLSRAET